jgi:hypothetical protein
VVPTGVAVSAVEGAAFTNRAVATFTDPGGPEALSNYSASINWGDSTPATAGTITLSGGTFTVSGSHTYGEEGSYTVTTTISHGTAPNATAASHATVSDPAVVAHGAAVSAKECITFTAPVATFTDPGGPEPNPSDPDPVLSHHYTATIGWGDSTPTSTGTISFAGSFFDVFGTHAYAEEGTFTITTTIHHELAPVTVVTSTATVRDNYGLLVLDPTGDMALMVTGQGNVTVNNCGAVVVNSNDSREAAFLTGLGTVVAAETDVTGGLRTDGNASLSGELNHEAATPDPLGLGLPPAPSPTFAAVHYSGDAPLTLSPGTYDGGIEVTGQGPVTLLPGVYYMRGGGFRVTGQGSVTGTGVLIVNAPSGPDDTVSLSGQGSVTLTAPTGLTGAFAAYNGITILQDPASDNTISITGQAHLTETGVIYAPMALLKIESDGGAVVNSDFAHQVNAEAIVFEAMVTGNGDLTINPDPPPPGGAPGGGPGGGGGGAAQNSGVGDVFAARNVTGLDRLTSDVSPPRTRTAGSSADGPGGGASGAAQFAPSALSANIPPGTSHVAAIDALLAAGSGINRGSSTSDTLFIDPVILYALRADGGLMGL